MAEHTPGPWGHFERHVYDTNGFLVAYASNGYTQIQDTGEALSPPTYAPLAIDANARLIAAAPDLLAACEAAHERLTSAAPGTPAEREAVVVALEAAIAKARGEGVA